MDRSVRWIAARRTSSARRPSTADVWQQRHEAGSLHGLRDRMLARSLATGLATTYNAAVPIGELAEQIQVFVIHEHGTRSNAIDAYRVFLGGAPNGFPSWRHGDTICTEWGETVQASPTFYPLSRPTQLPARAVFAAFFAPARPWEANLRRPAGPATVSSPVGPIVGEQRRLGRQARLTQRTNAPRRRSLR